jgi:hypothetical protein
MSLSEKINGRLSREWQQKLKLGTVQSRRWWKFGITGSLAGWLSPLLTEGHKLQRKNVPSRSLGWYIAEDNDFLYSTAVVDKLPSHHFDPESKRQYMDRHHKIS